MKMHMIQFISILKLMYRIQIICSEKEEEYELTEKSKLDMRLSRSRSNPLAAAQYHHSQLGGTIPRTY
jgi:hypothetical protein